MSYCTAGKQGYFDLCNATVKHYVVQNGNLQPVQGQQTQQYIPQYVNNGAVSQAQVQPQLAGQQAPEEVSTRYINWKRKADYKDFCKMRKYFEWRHAKSCSCSDKDCKAYYDWKLNNWTRHYDDAAYEPHFQAWKKYYDINDQKKYKEWSDWKKRKNEYKANPQKYLEKVAVEDIKSKIQALQPQAQQVKDQIATAIQSKADELRANGVDVNAVVDKVVQQVKVNDNVNGNKAYGPADYLHDRQYRKWKKSIDLREYVKFRRFMDFVEWAQKNGRQLDRNLFADWKKANNMLYNNKKRFECEYREFKHACNYAHYETFKIWVALRTKERCEAPETVESESSISACGSTLSDETTLGCPSYTKEDSCKDTHSSKDSYSYASDNGDYCSSDSSVESYESSSSSSSYTEEKSCDRGCDDKKKKKHHDKRSDSTRTNYSSDVNISWDDSDSSKSYRYKGKY